MTRSSADRNRIHPQERFAPPEELIDLDAAAAQLAAEDSDIANGHRQIALCKHGPMTAALFTFQAGSHLDDHVVDGPVLIQVLTGRVTITTSDGVHDLPAGSLLRLAPGVRHDVKAAEDSRLLVTFCLEGPDSHT